MFTKSHVRSLLHPHGRILPSVLTAAALAAGASIDLAAAANVHFKQNREPTFTDLGLTLNAQGALAGLGNGDIVVLLTASARATATCTNPSGQSQPPGQNPAPVTVSGSQPIPQNQFKNGTVGFNVTTQPPTNPIPGAPGCPNSQWTQTITDLSFTSATLTVQQPAGTTVLTATCTFSPATSNGPVPSRNVSCQSN